VNQAKAKARRSRFTALVRFGWVARW